MRKTTTKGIVLYAVTISQWLASIIILVLFGLTITGKAVRYGDYEYRINDDGTITFMGSYYFTDTFIIPDTINGLLVTSIGHEAFMGWQWLASVTIPNSVTNIEGEAFLWCVSLKSITIPRGVKSIKDATFYHCRNLTSITFPDGVTTIGDNAFSDCISLTNIIMPDTISNIGTWAFADCHMLTNVTIPNGVTSIGEYAFINCNSLTSVTIGRGVTNLTVLTFLACERLTNYTVNPLNPYFASLAGALFNNNLTTLIQYPLGNIGSYIIPNGVTNIGDYAFSYCNNLNRVTIPDSVTSIGIEAFYDCPSLISVFFRGDAPRYFSGTLSGPFEYSYNTTVYYLPGTTGWDSTFGGRPTVLWNPQPITTDASFGVQTNHYGFNIAGTAGIKVVVEASTNLANPTWFPVGTNTLIGGISYFSDPEWTNYPIRLYRLRVP
jgi:hypothetical protein